jgi:hypothetical protein
LGIVRPVKSFSRESKITLALMAAWFLLVLYAAL